MFDPSYISVHFSWLLCSKSQLPWSPPHSSQSPPRGSWPEKKSRWYFSGESTRRRRRQHLLRPLWSYSTSFPWSSSSPWPQYSSSSSCDTSTGPVTKGRPPPPSPMWRQSNHSGRRSCACPRRKLAHWCPGSFSLGGTSCGRRALCWRGSSSCTRGSYGCLASPSTWYLPTFFAAFWSPPSLTQYRYYGLAPNKPCDAWVNMDQGIAMIFPYLVMVK